MSDTNISNPDNLENNSTVEAGSSSQDASLSQSSLKKRKKKTKKICWLCKWGCLHVDYKDVNFLKRYLKNNKIITHKITGNCLKHQHQIATAVKRARIVALLPFVGE